MSWRHRINITTASTLIGILIFTLSNPYVPYNLLMHREVLHSNVGNYGTFYQPHLSISGLFAAGRFLVIGASPAIAALGAFSLFAAIRFCPTRGWMLAAPAIVVLIQFVFLADSKNAEYARFALLPDVLAAILAAALIARLKIKSREKILASAWLIAVTLYFGLRYDLNFLADGWSNSTRRVASQTLESQPSDTLAVWAEPAPYCMPPVDLFHWKIILLPRGSDSNRPGQISVRPVDDSMPATDSIDSRTEPSRAASPISWANKPFEILCVPQR